MKATISEVADKMNEWTGNRGTFKFIKGRFANGHGWSLMTTPGNAEKRQAELRALIGKEGDYVLEPDKEYNGVQQWRLKDYPGKAPQGGGGFGGKGYTVAWANTREGEVFRSASIQAQVALKCAVELYASMTSIDADGVLSAADKFHAWLTKHTPLPQEEAKPISHETAGTNGQVPHGPDKAVLSAWSQRLDPFAVNTDKLNAMLPEIKAIAHPPTLGSVWKMVCEFAEANNQFWNDEYKRFASRVMDPAPSQDDGIPFSWLVGMAMTAISAGFLA